MHKGSCSMQILEIRKEKRGRLLVVTEETGAFPLYEKEAARFSLKEGGELSKEDWEEICREILQKRVRTRALYLVQRRDRAEAKRRRRVTEGHYPLFLVDDADSYVNSYRYVDDLRYAKNYIRCHQSQKSRRQLQTALQQKGISLEEIAQALEEEYTAEEALLIRQLLEKKKYDGATATLQEKHKIYQFLLRRGFSNCEIRRQMDLT